MHRNPHASLHWRRSARFCLRGSHSPPLARPRQPFFASSASRARHQTNKLAWPRCAPLRRRVGASRDHSFCRLADSSHMRERCQLQALSQLLVLPDKNVTVTDAPSISGGGAPTANASVPPPPPSQALRQQGPGARRRAILQVSTPPTPLAPQERVHRVLFKARRETPSMCPAVPPACTPSLILCVRWSPRRRLRSPPSRQPRG